MVLIPLLHVICTAFVLVYAKPEGKAPFPIVLSFRVSVLFQIFWWIHINRISKLFRVFSDLPKRSRTYFFDYFIGWCANISSHSHVFKNLNEEIYPRLSSLRNRKPLRKIVLTNFCTSRHDVIVQRLELISAKNYHTVTCGTTRMT